ELAGLRSPIFTKWINTVRDKLKEILKVMEIPDDFELIECFILVKYLKTDVLQEFTRDSYHKILVSDIIERLKLTQCDAQRLYKSWLELEEKFIKEAVQDSKIFKLVLLCATESLQFDLITAIELLKFISFSDAELILSYLTNGEVMETLR